MTHFPKIQEKVCADAVFRMKQARDAGEFNTEKAKLLEALDIIRECSPNTYAEYLKYREMEFQGRMGYS